MTGTQGARSDGTQPGGSRPRGKDEPQGAAERTHASGGAWQRGHFESGPQGPRARMVDVGDKTPGERRALARARVHLPGGLLARALGPGGPKGPLLEVARTAGILAAKRAAEWIPMCHTLALDHVDLSFEPAGEEHLEVYCRVRCRAATGVEMEAMVGASAAALTVYDMLKGLERGIRIEAIELLEKQGGRSGLWCAEGWAGGAGLGEAPGPAHGPGAPAGGC